LSSRLDWQSPAPILLSSATIKRTAIGHLERHAGVHTCRIKEKHDRKIKTAPRVGVRTTSLILPASFALAVMLTLPSFGLVVFNR
jgi:hypothetical protein